jgi:DNA-binding beta-propeller fold protein YncE
VVDLDSITVERAFASSEVRSNRGTIVTPDGNRMFLTGGSLDTGLWFVFDTATHELLHSADSGGTDAHGVWFTPDGSELWL